MKRAIGSSLLPIMIGMIVLFAPSVHAQDWMNVGNPDFSPAEADFPSITTDTAGIPYVVFQDFGHSKKATVMKYNGTSWVYVGTPGFSTGAAYNTSIAIDKNGTPYVVYMDAILSDYAVVMKYNGTAWVAVGRPGFSAGEADLSVIAIDTAGTPYVAYEDYGNNQKVTVMKYADTGWTNVGSPGFSDSEANYICLAIDPSGTPYVFYQDFGYDQGGTVMKFNGTNWVPVGTPGFTDSFAYYESLAIDKNGTPYVAFSDYATSNGSATVMEYTAGNWTPVGFPAFTFTQVYYTSIAIDKNGKPYISYMDGGPAATYQASAMGYDNVNGWQSIGSQDFSPGEANNISMAIDKNGNLYVVFQDDGNGMGGPPPGNQASVMEYQVPSGVKNVAASTSSFNVFPDPNNGAFTINISAVQKEDATITITNVLGEKIKEFTAVTNTNVAVQLDYPAGMYFISAVTAEGKQSKKIMVQ